MSASGELFLSQERPEDYLADIDIDHESYVRTNAFNNLKDIVTSEALIETFGGSEFEDFDKWVEKRKRWL